MRISRAVILCLAALPVVSQAQQSPTRTPSEQTEVVRISTELVQTDVMVFDKDGKFVDGLKPEQFQLRVDGKPMPISFFERIAAGSINEEAQMAAARGGAVRGPVATSEGGVKPLDRGRTFFFFVDDLHQTFDGLQLTQKFLLDFIEKDLGQNDQAAITSSSGQIGFLQQLTNNKAVLRAAVARIKLLPRSPRDMQRPPMTEGMAMAIVVRQDQGALDFFTEDLVREGIPRESAENMVRGRAQQILQQTHYFTNNTLSALESLTRSAAGLPGRKVVFFLSNGFILDLTEVSTTEKLRNITNAAARNQVVIYSMDSRGLALGDISRASEEVAFDPGGRLASFALGDVTATQEPLRVLAANTGGRALLNSNSLSESVAKAIQDTSVYYLLAWRPEGEEQRGKKFRRIDVRIVGRQDLTVQVRGGFYDAPAQPPAKQEKAETKQPKVKAPEDELRETLKALFPAKALPTQLSLTYIDLPGKGPLLSASAQIESQFLTFEQSGDKSRAAVAIAGMILNDQGKSTASFKDNLSVVVSSTDPASLSRNPIIYNFPSQLSPGLYQVRFAARDDKSGRVGSASQWIEIPDLSSRKLTLSSLIISETTKEAESVRPEAAGVAESRVSVDRRFDRSSKLRFMTFIYNASRGDSGTEAPDVALQIQVLRDDQPVITSPLRKVQHEESADLSRIAYGADITLDTLQPGRYVLHITVIDRISKSSASQRTHFDVE